MSDIRYTEDHEWIRMDDDETGTVGITEYAQDQLGELVFVELPEIGRVVGQGSETAVIESVKAASELKAPVSGTVIEVNETLDDEPEKVNSDPTGDGWFIRVKLADAAELENLMDEEAYASFIEGLD